VRQKKLIVLACIRDATSKRIEHEGLLVVARFVVFFYDFAK
jgi:hypothetical protein